MKDGILAVDAGGSKCDAILTDVAGGLLGYGHCRQPGVSGRDRRAIEAAVRQALVTADFATLYVVGISGSPALAAADGRQPARIEGVPSSEPGTALLQAGLRYGCVLLAGTGAFAHARLADGRTCHLDGSGPLLGDFGGGYHVGRMALNATVRSDWHPRHHTSLRERILSRFGVATPLALFGLNLFGQDRSVVAALAYVVNEEAEAGDTVSRGILIRAAETLAETFRDVVSVLDLAQADVTVVGTGSLIRCSELYWQTLERQVALIAPRMATCRLEQPPVVGLAATALIHVLGQDAEPAIERLKHTPIPPLASHGPTTPTAT